MFKKAIKRFKIDIRQSYVVGDNINDIKVNLPFKGRFLIGAKRNDLFNLLAEEKIKPKIVKNLYEAVNIIIKTR
jgi:histidinol phosphatase-like enzyme